VRPSDRNGRRSIQSPNTSGRDTITYGKERLLVVCLLHFRDNKIFFRFSAPITTCTARPAISKCPAHGHFQNVACTKRGKNF